MEKNNEEPYGGGGWNMADESNDVDSFEKIQAQLTAARERIKELEKDLDWTEKNLENIRRCGIKSEVEVTKLLKTLRDALEKIARLNDRISMRNVANQALTQANEWLERTEK